MNELQIFNHPDFGQVRTVTINDEPWLVGKDVAQVLGYCNTKDALATHVDDEDKRILQRSEITTIENHIPKSALPINFTSADIPNRGLTIINESGLYSLALSSKLPGAKKFKHWVTSEVLPSILDDEKFGFYGYDDFDYNCTDLLAPPAFEELYLYWLEAKIHYYNGDNDQYNAAMILFNSVMQEFGDHHRRNHRAAPSGRFRF